MPLPTHVGHSPLLPTHVGKTKHIKRKGNTVIRLVIGLTLLLCIGYSFFAFSFLTKDSSGSVRSRKRQDPDSTVVHRTLQETKAPGEKAKHLKRTKHHATSPVNSPKIVAVESEAEPTEEAKAPETRESIHRVYERHHRKDTEEPEPAKSHDPGHVTHQHEHSSPYHDPSSHPSQHAHGEPSSHGHGDPSAHGHGEPSSHQGSHVQVHAPRDTAHVVTEEASRVVTKHEEQVAIKSSPAHQGLFALSATDIDGNTVPLSKYAGKVVIVVNVASACGYTDSNYKGLQATYDKYKKFGLEVLGFPCNQFGQQEPGSEADIKDFCTTKYHVTFPMFSKIDVNGANMHPVYKFLRQELPVSEGGGGGQGYGRDIGWNFFKFVVNRAGQPVKLFHQTWDVAAVEAEIYKLLHESEVEE